MTQHYNDYVWKKGLPYGVRPCGEDAPLSYRIVSDPYHKRNSVEEYKSGCFSKVIYDSALFDFRQLKAELQTAWHKTLIEEAGERTTCHIRNQDGRLILIEKYAFESNRCRECEAYSPQGILLSVQKIHYEKLKDPYDGVTLFDSNAHQVLLKKYAIDEETGEFTQLLHEQWD
ncbi:MAG: hypothetical protein WCF65_05235 [Parachlamydiaceae bacterium]